MIAKALSPSMLCAAALALPAFAQPEYAPPRTPDGRPDLQGTWTNSSITTLERNNASLPLLLNDDQVRRMEDTRLEQAAADYAHWFGVRLKHAEGLLHGDHAAAGRFTMADISVGYAVMLAQSIGLDEQVTPGMKAYFERLTQRAGFQRAKAAQGGAGLGI